MIISKFISTGEVEMESNLQNWNFIKLKNISQITISTVDRHEFDDEEIVSICHYPQAYKNEIITRDTKLSTGTCTLSEKTNFSLKRGQIIVTKDSESADDIGVASFIEEEIFNAVCGYHLAIINPDESKINSKFLFWFLRSNYAKNYFATNSNGVTRFGLGKTTLENLYVPYPSLKEQSRITEYINERTKVTDEIIRRKKAIIELLKQKKLSLIGEVITQGIKKNVLVKDSGHKWLGKIPDSWDIKKIKALFKIKKEIAGELGYNVLSVTQRGIKIKDITTNKGQISFDYSKYQIVEPGDFVMNHMDLLTGYVDISQYNGVTSPDYRVFKLIDGFSCPRFYLYVFQFCYLNKVFYGLGQGVSQMGRWRMPSQEFYNFPVPCPSKEEQELIVNFLDNRIQQIDKAILMQQSLISKLSEYRLAIITEAIGGKHHLNN